MVFQNAVIGDFVIRLLEINAVYLFCFTLDGTRGRQLTPSLIPPSVFMMQPNQLEHDGQVQPQESITGEQRPILDMALRCIDEK